MVTHTTPTAPAVDHAGPLSAPSGSVRSRVLTVLHGLGLLLSAGAVFVAYQIGVLGSALGILIGIVAFVVLVLTVIRLLRRRAHVSWLRTPLARGSRRFVVQFLLRAALWIFAAEMAVIAFPRVLTGSDEAMGSYVFIWGSAAFLVLAGLVPARRVSWLNLTAYAVATLALITQLIQLNVPAPGAVTLGSPVRGTWMAASAGRSGLVNHHYGLDQQRDAIDLAIPFERDSAHPPTRLTDFPAYGQPLYAPADGVMVRVSDGQPDQPIGSSDTARPLGNHLVLQVGAERYVLMAHLRAGDIAVSEGQRVHRGQLLAAVGNSGNTSEPHLHLQVQSGLDLLDATGVPTPGLVTFPMAFADADRVRDGHSVTPARDVRLNDVLIFR